MNFLHILRKSAFIFFLLTGCSTFSNHLFSNSFQELGIPHIQVYLPEPYTHISHFSTMAQDADGFLYVGTRAGLLRFDGLSWSHIEAPPDLKIIQHEQQIFAYASDRFGLLKRNPRGVPAFHDLVPAGSLADQPVEEVWPAGNVLYVQTGEGLFYWDQDSLHPYIGGTEIRPVFRLKDSLQIKLGEQNFHQLNRLLDQFGYTSHRRLSSGHLVVGTQSGGLLVHQPDGQMLFRLTMEEGLYADKIVGLFIDASDNLWLIHEAALSRVEIPSAFTHFDARNGLPGNILEVARHAGTLYVASHRGVFRMTSAEEFPGRLFEPPRFKPVEGFSGENPCFAQMGSALFAASAAGLFRIENKEAFRLSSAPLTTLFFDSTRSILLAGSSEGLILFDAEGKEMDPGPDLPGIRIDHIGQSPDGRLWLSSNQGKIFRTAPHDVSANQLRFEVYQHPAIEAHSQGVSMKFFRSDHRLYLNCCEHLLVYDENEQAFVKDSLFRIPGWESAHRIVALSRAPDDVYWIAVNRNHAREYLIYQGEMGSDGLNDLHQLTYRRLYHQHINCIYPEKDGVTWIGSTGGMVRVDQDFKSVSPPSFQTFIRSITLTTDSVYDHDYLQSDDFVAQLNKDRLVLPHSENSIRFDFQSTDYNSEHFPLYQYRLAGLQDNWSEWSDNNFIRFSDLSRGRYTFMVRSQDVFGTLSETEEFSFRIRPVPLASWPAIVFYLLFFLLALYGFQRWRNYQHMQERFHLEEVIKERTEALIKEKEKTENLLANILPKKTAEELKTTGKASSSKFKMVTVLFADIQGFTKIAEHMNPDKLIDELDRFYFQFDSVVEKYNIEKIKTIGDAYMAAGGIPIKNRTNPVEVILAAMEMQAHMKELKKTKTDIWDLRIGIHTGSVIAGVVGSKKFSYDIWGDSVNTASRMESSGEPGRVNISSATYKLVKHFFDCEFRGKMPVKFKGDIAMFFVNGIKPDLAETDGTTPNKRFRIQLQLLRLLDLEEMIMEKLEKELPEDLYFHNAQHTYNVYTQVELLGRGEKVGEEDLLMIRTAALMHDTGYIKDYEDHLTRSIDLAREILPLYRYEEEQIERICKLIAATRQSYKHTDILEKIMCDANLDHVGRVDYVIQSDKLYQELRMKQKVKSKRDWNQYQINFLKNHEFLTPVAQKLREISREEQIDNIRKYS